MTDKEYYEVFKDYLPENGFLMASEMVHIQGVERTAEMIMKAYREGGHDPKEDFRLGVMAFLRHLKINSTSQQ